MSLNNNQDYATFELEYKSTNDSQIRLFNPFFVGNNKNKCKIIYNEKEYDLRAFDNNYNHNSIKIQLRINNNITDLSHMFYKCKELLSIRDLSDDNITDINKSFNKNNSNNSGEKSDNPNEISETFYNNSLALSSIPKNTNSSIYSEINGLNNIKENIFKNVTNMSGMFGGCSSLISLPDISKWDTKKVYV